jgi:hypothetical protein
MRSPCCLCVCESPPISFWIPEPIYIKLDMYTRPPESTSKAYFINPSHQSVCLHVYSRVSFLGNGSVDTFPRQRIHTKLEVVLEASFYIRPCLIKGDSVGLCIPLSLLGIGSLNTFPRQWGIVGGIVFCMVHVVWKEIRQIVIPRTSFQNKGCRLITLNNRRIILSRISGYVANNCGLWIRWIELLNTHRS